VGLIPVFLRSDAQGVINRIIAPDILYNSYFGWGARGRIYEYPTESTRWSLVGGGKQRVERQFDGEYQSGLTREQPWSFSASAIYDRSGTSRFFGIGNETPRSDESNYTDEQELLQAAVGWNINHAWQLGYLLRFHNVDVSAGTLPGLPSTTDSFPGLPGLGTSHELLNRVMLTYDTRDNVSVPRGGVRVTLYGGLSSRSGFLNDSLYSEFGLDARGLVPLDRRTVLAMHTALRYLPSAHELPFWAYSTLGGDQSVIGGTQPLRGFGEGRFTDRHAFSLSVELRRIVTSFEAVATHIDLELAPFVDAGRVFAQASTSPLSNLHQVYGFGVRAIARPYIVAYVDIGYSSEGSAAFSGINYIF
jgi:outer membrane protein assembly factor BamA